jgi:hypothetical protein
LGTAVDPSYHQTTITHHPPTQPSYPQLTTSRRNGWKKTVEGLGGGDVPTRILAAGLSRPMALRMVAPSLVTCILFGSLYDWRILS